MKHWNISFDKFILSFKTISSDLQVFTGFLSFFDNTSYNHIETSQNSKYIYIYR